MIPNNTPIALLYSLVMAFLISAVLISMDISYAMYNQYFDFSYTNKEFFNKLLPLSFLVTLISQNKIRRGIYIVFVLISFIQYVHFSYFGKNIHAIEFYLIF